MNKKYSKPLGNVLGLKRYFLESNDSLVEAENENIEVYKKQSKREVCKICGTKLEEAYFVRKAISYYSCKTCSHLNGEYEDTKEFNEFIYIKEKPDDKRREHQTIDLQNYLSKVENIYLPKVEFFFNSIETNDIQNKKFLDLGCGVGHLVYSVQKNYPLVKTSGIDVSKDQIDLGNEVLKEELLKVVPTEKVLDFLESSDANFVSMIMVLEHIENPVKVLQTLRKNKNVEYLLIAVPLVSFSVMTQLVFKDVFERLLYGGHTHLYTYESLKHLIDIGGFEIVDEWWFGSDIFDLLRSMLIDLQKSNPKQQLLEDFENRYFPIIDEMQKVIDKAESSSEVHMVLKKRC